MRIHQIPEQFKADLAKADAMHEETAGALDTSLQQDEEEEFSHSFLKRPQHLQQNENNTNVMTDQDTIID